jgi:hypothetical protein
MFKFFFTYNVVEHYLVFYVSKCTGKYISFYWSLKVGDDVS